MSSEASNPTHPSIWWDRIVDAHATTVWAVIRAQRLPEYVALEVNQLTWMRLADHLDAMEAGRIEEWLMETARREAARSARLSGFPREPGD
jgi:hypothetical protein